MTGINGFEINNSAIERISLSTSKEVSLWRRYTNAIIVSVVVHFLLAIVLLFMAKEQPVSMVEITTPAINSYLYQKPKKPVVLETISKKPVVEKIKDKVAEKLTTKTIIKDKRQAPANTAKIVTDKVNNVASKKTLAPAANTVNKPARATFSSYQQLDNLRKSINKQIIAEGLSQQQQFTSPSVMHAQQAAVPHSSVQLSHEQQREKNTTRMSDDISMTKYDNGVCTIQRKQFLGSPVEGSTSAFACGESKFDKNFRQHMKKVQNKLSPISPRDN